MEFGLMSLGDLLPHPHTGETVSEAERHRSLVDQAVLAESLGFTAVHLGEHHFSHYMLSAPPVVLAAIGERTSTLQLSTAVTLAGNLDPVRVAEDYATVDALSGGRVEIVTGRGNLFAHTYEGFGQPVETARERYDESILLLDRLLREKDVHWEGQFRAPLRGHTTRPRPHGPMPLWIGAGSTESATLAADVGAHLMLPTVFGTPELFAPLTKIYRERWAENGRDPAAAMVGACSHCHVTTGSGREWKPFYSTYWDFVGTLLADSSLADGRWPSFDFDRLTSSTAICGTPDEVTNRIGEIGELLGLDRHLVMFDLGGMASDEALSVIELFGSSVMPHFVS